VQVVNPKADVLFAASRPVQLSVPSRLEVSWRPLDEKYDIDSVSGSNLNNVPLELRNFVGLLHQAQRDLRTGVETGKLTCTSPDALSCLYATANGPQIPHEIEQLKAERGINTVLEVSPSPAFSITLSASGEVPIYDDLSGVHGKDALQRNSEYQVVSLISDAKDTDLRTALDGNSYPDWVTDRYTSVPATVPSRVGELADKIVADAQATNPYDQAKAIETYLRTNYVYTTTITQPPTGVDRVEWFLFEGKEGYCEYYASAMIIMLRHLGIPARLAGGYAPGTIDTKTGKIIVKESSAHAWPEVYFPKFGWIEFEPTPSQAVITHSAPAESTDVPTPEPTVGARLSPTPFDDNGEPHQPVPSTTDGSSGGFNLPFGAAGGALLVASIVAALAALLFFLPASPLSRTRTPGNARFYYARMLFWSRLLRAGPAAHQTPYEYGEALSREVQGIGPYARTIARAYVRERFSREPLDLGERRTLRQTYDTLRSRLWKSLPGRQVRRITRRAGTGTRRRPR
jgi:transglutaminase-like putative cysteine protease